MSNEELFDKLEKSLKPELRTVIWWLSLGFFIAEKQDYKTKNAISDGINVIMEKMT